MGIHFNIHPEAKHISPASRANAITKAYYYFLVGEINRGTIKAGVCRIENKTFGTTSYHLLTS